MENNTVDYNEIFKVFWSQFLLNEDSTVNIDKVKRELADYKCMLDEVVQVYNILAETRAPLMPADNVIASAHTLQQEYLRDICVEDLKKQVDTNGMIHISNIQEYFTNHEIRRTVKCDKGCQKRFVIDEVDILSRTVKEDIEEECFKCPHCGTEYTITYTNKQIRQNQVEMKNIRHQLKAVTTVKKQEKLFKRYEELKLENERIRQQIVENI
ncbi:hypothetical protein P4J60_20860 [Bacillus cereus]|nr:hypothetical protein [Bacillus cereus]MEB9569667.1 hypothetical protein [Bacillus cereus]